MIGEHQELPDKKIILHGNKYIGLLLHVCRRVLQYLESSTVISVNINITREHQPVT
jgi:hypothetical protein